MNDYIGKYVKRFESGNKGSLALDSCGNDWGLSCGSYQLTLRWGNCIKFLKRFFPKESEKLYYVNKDLNQAAWPGKEYCSSPEEVKTIWMACYNKVGKDKFFEYEHEYIKNNYYDRIKDRLKNEFDLDKASRAFQECFWSWSVHSGVSGAYNNYKIATKNLNINTVSEEVLFDALYDQRFKQTGTNRYKRGWADGERETLRPLLNQKGDTNNMSYKPIVCMMTQSTCYRETTTMNVLGVLWHSTGANNPNLKRYVQPDDDAANRDELIELIGKNQYKNDLNHYEREMGVNAWIGKLANGEVATLQTLPWNYRPWGCGKGKKGSCNSGWIQFEICEDSLNNKDYFDKIYKEACTLTAYLCKMYNIDPFGTQTLNGVVVPTILCHADSYKLGLGNNHGDVLHWFKKYNKTMDDVRKDVAALLGNTTPIVDKESIGVATSTRLVNVRSGPGKKYRIIGLSIKGSEFEVVEEVDGWLKIIWNKGKYEYAYVDKRYFNFVEINKFYKGQTTASTLNIRSGAGTNYNVVGTLKKGSVITIVEEKNNWGKLDNNKGWVSLQYVKKI